VISDHLINGILQLGEGLLPTNKRDGDSEPTWIEIPHELLIYTDGPKNSSVSKLYLSTI
jgi:hypothetical protein